MCMSTRSRYDTFYVTAGNKKYFVLQDSEEKPLWRRLNRRGTISQLQRAEGRLLHLVGALSGAAGRREESQFLHATITPPFDDIPIAD